ncbi:MAG: ATP-binding protein, partial [Rhizobacter sp.]|nr:ATP-binding protein [Rhizobacter sp.]
LLFTDAPKALVERIELVVRLVRSKGVGVYFVTQNPLDIPDTVLAQLGNRVQHALRAFTPRDQKAVKAAASTMRANPTLDTETVITELGVGEALVSLLDDKGRPSMVERVFVLPPASQIGPITAAQRKTLIANSLVAGVYETTVDRDSAYEKLKGRAAASPKANEVKPLPGGPSSAASDGASSSGPGQPAPGTYGSRPTGPVPTAGTGASSGTAAPGGGMFGGGWLSDVAGGLLHGSGRKDSVLETVAKSAARSIGSTVGRELIRGVLGSLMGAGSRKR